MYNPSGYITPTGQPKPRVELPVEAEISVVREDGPNQWLDDLAELEEDIANLQFFNEQDTGDVTINWFDLEGSAEAIGWLSDEPNVVEVHQLEQEPSEKGTTMMAGMAGNQEQPLESTSDKNFAQDQNSLRTKDADQQAALKHIDRLGKKPKENSVSGSFVSNSSLTNITNGVRIKTFHNSPKIQASNITFEDITIKDVSLAKISDVHYRNIRDSSVSNVAVTLNCSSSVPCEGIELIDIDIILNSNSLKKLLPLSSSYSFAKPVFKGKQNSPTCE
ncbi:polygalacturonase-like [Camellia sinensis]|uniref:polygalacturonase-like n=1 Tax=Camellia sinensis TaxID=4442 RepID=UPI001035CF37|nr:polygalacturonase-like [Camellia sinensis]